jgi:outer membrane receptor protein involved in Fe transport
VFGLFFSLAGFAQQKGEIEGRVVDERSGEPLPGASVSLVKEKTGTATDENGFFTLHLQSLPATISVSYLGYKNFETVIDRYTASLVIPLVENADLLNEVVVVGYGTQRRKELTGAISTVSKTLLDNNVALSVDALLSGAAAGVNVTQVSGQPGGGSSIRIRGGNSINAGNEPLYVIDGFIFYADPANNRTDLSNIESELNPLA